LCFEIFFYASDWERSTQAARNALAGIQDKHKDIGDARVCESSIYQPLFKKIASQSHHKYKIIIFFSGDVNDEANFSFFILLHKRAKPIHPPLKTSSL
jgi:hypothetical protein